MFGNHSFFPLKIIGDSGQIILLLLMLSTPLISIQGRFDLISVSSSSCRKNFFLDCL